MKQIRWRASARSVILTGGLLVAFATAMPRASQDRNPEAQVDGIFTPWVRADSPGCAVSVMRDGTVVYAQGYGMANLEYDIPIVPSSVFHVASVSKQFTAMAVALLASDGRLSWNDDIRMYVPEVPDFGTRITLRHLVHHTSGLRDQWSLLHMAGWRFEADVVRQEDVLDLVSRQTALNFEPGAQYLYSNTGFTLLALVVERVAGKTLREFAEERIFEPLGMMNTHFHDDHQMIVENRAYAYAPDRDGTLRLSIPDFDVVGATNLFTTVEDMARWDRNFYTVRVGGREVLEQLLTRGVLNGGETISYASGLAHGTHRGFESVGHGGADAGYRSHFVRFPRQRLSVVALCNAPSSNPRDLSLRVADIYLADQSVGFTPSAADRGAGASADPSGAGPAADAADDAAASLEHPAKIEDVLASRAGYYRQAATDAPMHLVVRDGGLTILSGGPRQPLVPLGPNRFRLGETAAEVSFPSRRPDAPVALRLHTAARDTLFTRAGAAHLSPDDLAGYVGAFYSAELAIQYTLEVDAGKLVIRHRKLGRLPLTPTFVDGFFTSPYFLTFSRGPGDEVDGFTISTDRAWKVRFNKQ